MRGAELYTPHSTFTLYAAHSIPTMRVAGACPQLQLHSLLEKCTICDRTWEALRGERSSEGARHPSAPLGSSLQPRREQMLHLGTGAPRVTIFSRVRILLIPNTHLYTFIFLSFLHS